jgi:hypothetical protein
MPPTDRKGTLFGGDAVHVALILQTRATARRARNGLSASQANSECLHSHACAVTPVEVVATDRGF